MAKFITITSGKGGVGKTTTAINLGAALNAFGKDVIVLDANMTTPNVGLHLGAPIVPISLNHVLNGKAKLSDAIYEHESGTKIIPSSLSVNDLKKIDFNKFKEVVKKLRNNADYVIFDSAAGLGQEALAAMDVGDEVVIVTNPEITAVTDALKTSKLLEQMGKEVKGVIVNKVKRRRTEMPAKNIAEMLELPILGIIPEDNNMSVALLKKNALMHTHPRSKAARAYRMAAARLIGLEDYREKSIFERIFG
jgi:septum site-determining protein MinD